MKLGAKLRLEALDTIRKGIMVRKALYGAYTARAELAIKHKRA